MSETVFSPATLALADSSAAINAGVAKVARDGELVVDMENLRQCDSSAICLLIELFRNGKQKNCRIIVRNTSPQLKKLMQFYRLTDMLSSPG